MAEKIEKRGGARQNAGAPPKFGEKIEQLVVYVPKSKKEQIRKRVKEIVKDYEVRKYIVNVNGLYLNCERVRDIYFTKDKESATFFKSEEHAKRAISRLPIALRAGLKVI